MTPSSSQSLVLFIHGSGDGDPRTCCPIVFHNRALSINKRLPPDA